MSPAVFLIRQSILRFGLFVSTIIPLSGQENSPLNTGLLMDLGIVIESSTGNETYSRTIPNTSTEKSLAVQRLLSGDITSFINKDLLVSIDKINARLSDLETSFNSEVMALRSENTELKTMLASISTSKMVRPATPYTFMEENQPSDIHDLEIEDLPVFAGVEILPLKSKLFDETLYRSGMYAYQCGNLATALSCFADISLDNASVAQAENILYWTADAFLQMHEYEKALATLDRLLNYASSNMAADALVKKGLLYKDLGDIDLAMNTFKKVVVGHPESEYTRLATLEIKRGEIKHQ